MASSTAKPNILITGTPGTGKTTTASAFAAAAGLVHVDVGAAIKEQELHQGWDDDFQCHIVDEDKVSGDAALRGSFKTARCRIGSLATEPALRRSATRSRRKWRLAETW